MYSIRWPPIKLYDILRLFSFYAGDQFLNIHLGKTKEVQNIDKALSVKARRCLQLYLALRTPCYSETGGVDHEKIVGTVAHGQGLGNGN